MCFTCGMTWRLSLTFPRKVSDASLAFTSFHQRKANQSETLLYKMQYLKTYPWLLPRLMKKKQHGNSGNQTAMKRLHRIGFVLALFTSQDFGILSPPFKQQWQQCCSCKACGPGSSLHTLAVVYLEEAYEEWEQPWGWNWHFPECSNVAFGSCAC